VRLYFDESGDFAFPDDRFDAYTQAVLICADSKLDEVEEYVAGKKEKWGVPELHANDLTDEQILEICLFIHDERLPGLVLVTDTNGVTRKSIETHRLDQTARIHKNYEDWRAAGGSAPAVDAWYQRHISAVAYSGRVPDSEWVQADLLLALIERGLNKTIVSHLDDEWREDFRDLHFILDSKLRGKLAAGEKYLDAVLMPALGSNPGRFQLIGVIEWRQPPVHPFEEKYGTPEGTVPLRVLFEHGLEFEPSEDHAGLQLVDVVAYVTRRRIVNPENEVNREAWSLIRPRIMTLEGEPIHLMRFRPGGDDADTSRYADL
jgi:hypothetical protein